MPAYRPYATPFVLLFLGVFAGCRSSPGGELTIRSLTGGGTFQPGVATAVYRAPDNQTADIYLTDLPTARLADPADKLADLSGSVVQIHIFVMPRAGRTPIDPTACNATIRHLVLAQGAAGLYGGGGFVDPSDDPGDATFSASVDDATVRLVRATPDFADKLSEAAIAGQAKATLNNAAALAIAARFESICAGLPPVASPMAEPVTTPGVDPASDSKPKPAEKTGAKK